ncbi:MAG: isoaspartyl peptidase/L-asparaginase, partial [Actinomycetia bacterium]|nr:isoaspartyl peptidase/L-asparaginase [Actinomycetes bacterium]
AVDMHGHVAAATSTGGIENQALGRVGDTPILGAGTWARDDVVAVSCTGHGEAFMLGAVAHQVSARVEYGLQDVADAARTALNDEVAGRGFTGALIAVTPKRRCVLAWNAPTLLAAWRENGELRTRL